MGPWINLKENRFTHFRIELLEHKLKEGCETVRVLRKPR
jgi:hypothetical protein